MTGIQGGIQQRAEGCQSSLGGTEGWANVQGSGEAGSGSLEAPAEVVDKALVLDLRWKKRGRVSSLKARKGSRLCVRWRPRRKSPDGERGQEFRFGTPKLLHIKFKNTSLPVTKSVMNQQE